MGETLAYSLVVIFAVFLASCAQIILKKEANKVQESSIKNFINLRICGAYGIFVITVFINMYTLRYIPLSLFTALESVGFVFIAILSFVFFGEKLNKMQICGIFLIIIGIIIFNY